MGKSLLVQVNEALAYVHQLWKVNACCPGRQGLLTSLNRLNVGFAFVNVEIQPFSIHGDTRQWLRNRESGSLILKTPKSGKTFMCSKRFQIIASLDNC